MNSKLLKISLFIIALFSFISLSADNNKEALELLDLNEANLSKVEKAYNQGNYRKASNKLLKYFRHRTNVAFPDFDKNNVSITKEELRWANEAFNHQFFVHTGYQPSLNYGKDINWEYWPIKDNELRWQLHRLKWWLPLAQAYKVTGKEKYAKEWTFEYLDWIKKNILKDDYDESSIKDIQKADNQYFAWRPLEVSHRLQYQIPQFMLMLPSKHFDGDFLSSFLINYHKHCEHLIKHLSTSGNHLLFEAQRLLYAAVFFPEFKDSKRWRDTAIEVLNREIKKQVYSDGLQYELDPHYHLESINIFFRALNICDANGLRNAFPQSYIDTLHKMIEATYNYSFPNYTNPMFSDFHGHHPGIDMFQKWQKVFPKDEVIRWLASNKTEGHCPKYLSKAFDKGGMYIARNGWDSLSTVMVLKAGPPAFWHCQPDNGTFEYWRKGRDFFPDSGGYVYGGDEEILKQRAWFRQTAIHNTLTLDGKNSKAGSKLISWVSDSTFTVYTIENPSYENLTHRRTVMFNHKDGSVVIKDEAIGSAEGLVEIHYALLESDPIENFKDKIVKTNFKDGNNITLFVSANKEVKMSRTEGRISYTYKHYKNRPLYNYSIQKKGNETICFITVIQPSK